MKKATFIADANIALRILRGNQGIEPNNAASMEMLEQATWIVEEVEAGNMTLHFPDAVVPEIVYVLHKSYKESREDSSDLILSLISADGVIASEPMKRAVEKFATVNLDIVDLYLAELSQGNGLPVLSWDKGFNKTNCEYFTPKELYQNRHNDENNEDR